MRQGIIQVYTGDGKGKTTAAIGQAIRAWGRGLKIIIFQMLKAENSSGEQIALAQFAPAIRLRTFGTGEFIFNREPTKEESELALAGWKEVEKAIFSNEYDLVVIDELRHAINTKLIAEEKVIEVLKEKPGNVEIVITGRNMPDRILKIADLITEMKERKHPYSTGISAREGIEF